MLLNEENGNLCNISVSHSVSIIFSSNVPLDHTVLNSLSVEVSEEKRNAPIVLLKCRTF